MKKILFYKKMRNKNRKEKSSNLLNFTWLGSGRIKVPFKGVDSKAYTFKNGTNNS